MIHTASIARHLAAEGAVVFGQAGANCFLETLPDTPADAVAVFTLPGGGDDYQPWGMAGAQLIVRADGSGGAAREGYERAADLRTMLHGLRHVTLAPGTADELRLVWCKAQTRLPVGLGRDAEQRHKWSVGFELLVLRPDPHGLP